ncbi:MAG: DMT family transporter [Firmicutes bacterium]|jgi:drug/metabolite transporter (DMT)-like permease|nr:DMT family transporter [Bacillota bacterium]
MGPAMLIFISMLIWGSVGLFVRFVDLPATEIVFIRAVIAGAILFVYRLIFVKEKKRIPKNEIVLLVFAGIALSLNWLFLFKAYKYTTITIATLCNYMSPVFITIAASVFLKDKITFKKVISIGMATVGLAIVVFQNSGDPATANNQLLGVLYGLMSAVQYAVIVILNKKVKYASGLDITLIQILSSLIIMTPIVFYKNTIHFPNMRSLYFAIGIGVIHTTIPYLLYFTNLHKLPVQKVVILSYFDPISAVFYSALLLGEPLTIFHIVGTALILGSTAITMERRRKAKLKEGTSSS